MAIPGLGRFMDAPRTEVRGAPSTQRGKAKDYWFSFVCPIISCAEKLIPQVGKELPTKKLSDWSGKKSWPSLKFGSSTMASGSLTDCGTTLPSSAAMAVFIATATWAGPVPADEHFRP